MWGERGEGVNVCLVVENLDGADGDGVCRTFGVVVETNY